MTVARAVPAAAVRAATRGRRLALPVCAGALAIAAALPERHLQSSVVMALNSDQGETVGWPSYVAAVSRAWRAIPAPERRHAAIVTRNYGEAGAIDVLGRAQGLPYAHSGHDGFSEWGAPGPDVTHVLLTGYRDAGDAAPAFAGCRRLGTVDNGVGLDNQEQGLALLLCRPTAPWRALWPRLTHFD